MTALELGHCLYLISKQRFESVLTLQGKPSSHDRWALTGVPHGNLSLAHTEIITVASHPRVLSSLTCARLLAGCFQHAHSPCPQKGKIHPVGITPLPTRCCCRLRRFTVPHNTACD